MSGDNGLAPLLCIFCFQHGDITVVDALAYWVDIGSKAAAMLGFLVAVAAGCTALWNYWTSISNAEQNHVHSLFLRYLDLRYDFSKRQLSRSEPIEGELSGDDESLLEQVATFKLYVLEEMFNWTEHELRKLGRWYKLRPWKMSKAKKKHKMDVETWRASIRSHIYQHRKAVEDSLKNYVTCYGTTFLRFIADTFQDADIIQLTEEQERAVFEGRPRPPGKREDYKARNAEEAAKRATRPQPH